MTGARDLRICATPADVARNVAQWLLDQALATPDRFAICLSGGRTPEMLYRLLADDPWRAQLPWPRLHWFFGDERFVPPDDARSNAGMVHRALFSRAPVPAENIHAMATRGLALDEAALTYARRLRDFYGADRLQQDRPLFDVNFLGLGTDGHTASLLPGDAAAAEQAQWVCPVPAGAGRPEPRITLTRPVLESSRHTAFLVTGANKAPMLRCLLQGDSQIPAAQLRPQGARIIFADAAAAGTDEP